MDAGNLNYGVEVYKHSNKKSHPPVLVGVPQPHLVPPDLTRTLAVYLPPPLPPCGQWHPFP